MSCTFLSANENGLVFQLVGRNSLAQCTSIVQLFQSAAPKHSKWIKKYTGALCFVKDSTKRSYYFRLYCLIRHEMMWEQEIYDEIKISKPRPYFLTFEGQYGMVAFNFAFDEEAETFLQIVSLTVKARKKRHEERQSKQIVMKTKKKFEIGAPSNVKHVVHVGWDGKRDFGLTPIDQKFKSLASHLVGCQYKQKGVKPPKRNQQEPLPPVPMSSNKKPLTIPNKSTSHIKMDSKNMNNKQESQTIIRDNKGGYIVRTTQKANSKSSKSTAPDVSKIVQMALKAHKQQEHPSQRYTLESSTDTSDSEDW